MEGISIKQATKAEVPIIRQLAIAIWWPTYGDYLPHDQIRTMLEKIYAERSLIQQQENHQTFLLIYRMDRPIGFVGFTSEERSGIGVTRIEKLYILPSEQGTGLGKLLLDEVGKYACAYGASYVELYVNRNNPAKAFYEKQGFTVVKEIDIPYHNYVLNDYIMQKTVTP